MPAPLMSARGAPARLPASASRRTVLAAVFSSSLGVGLSFGFQPPLIALVLSRRGASGWMVGAVTAATLIAVIVLGPWYPWVMVRLGLKRCVVVGVSVAAMILLVMPWVTGVGAWLVLRLLTGSALGMTWIASEVWMNDVSRPDQRGVTMGIYGTVFSCGSMAGPALLQCSGTSGRAPFTYGSIALLVTLLPMLLLRGVHSERRSFAPLRNFPGALRAAPIVMLAALVAGLVEAAEVSLLPLFGVHAGFDEPRALMLVTVFMAGNVVLQTPIGWLADRLGRRLLLSACALASGIGPLLLGASLRTPSLLWPLLFVWGGTLFAFYGQGVALLGGVFSGEQLPTANTVFVMVYCMGGIIGPTLGGLLLDAWPRHGLPLLLSVPAFVLFAALLAERGGRPAAVRPHG